VVTVVAVATETDEMVMTEVVVAVADVATDNG